MDFYLIDEKRFLFLPDTVFHINNAHIFQLSSCIGKKKKTNYNVFVGSAVRVSDRTQTIMVVQSLWLHFRFVPQLRCTNRLQFRFTIDPDSRRHVVRRPVAVTYREPLHNHRLCKCFHGLEDNGQDEILHTKSEEEPDLLT